MTMYDDFVTAVQYERGGTEVHDEETKKKKIEEKGLERTRGS